MFRTFKTGVCPSAVPAKVSPGPGTKLSLAFGWRHAAPQVADSWRTRSGETWVRSRLLPPPRRAAGAGSVASAPVPTPRGRRPPRRPPSLSLRLPATSCVLSFTFQPVWKLPDTEFVRFLDLFSGVHIAEKASGKTRPRGTAECSAQLPLLTATAGRWSEGRHTVPRFTCAITCCRVVL